MGGPLLPFAYDQSRQDENLPPLNLSQPRQKKRSADHVDFDDIGPNNSNHIALDKENINTVEHKNGYLESSKEEFDDDIDENMKSTGFGFFYSSLNSSSSALVDNNYPGVITNFTNTSSTVLNFNNNDLSSDSIIPLNSNADDDFNNGPDVPSSPMLQSLPNIIDNQDPPLTSDAFDELMFSNKELKQSIPSSPTLLPLSQSTVQEKSHKFQRPKLTKQVHPLSRHGSTFTEPTRKKQRMTNADIHKKVKLQPPPPPILESKVEFAIDRDGHVYGYNLEKDELPPNYRPTLYDEPIYFVVKNSSKQEHCLRKAIDEFFEQPVNSKNPISVLNLQYFELNSLPDYVTDIQDFYDCTEEGIIKPVIHIDASYNKLRSVNPRIFCIERLQMFSLRNNKIARLSGSIEKAQNLKNLNLAMNQFKFLPHNILNLPNLDVLVISGNPMIPQTSVDESYDVDPELLSLYSKQNASTEFLDTEKELKCFSRIHWLKSNKQISKSAVHASILSRSLSTIQDLCFDDNGNIKDWDDFESNDNNSDTKLKLRKEKQSFMESKLPWVPKLSELSLRQISKYLISQSEVQKWKDSTSEFIYKRAMNSLIYGTNGETCGYCNKNCIESVADMLEWWDFKGSKSVTIKRRFCSKHCATCWIEKLNKFKYLDKTKP